MFNQLKYYKYRLEGVAVNNRWRRKPFTRSDNWVIFGFSKRWFMPMQFEYAIHLFGIDIGFWFRKISRIKK